MGGLLLAGIILKQLVEIGKFFKILFLILVAIEVAFLTSKLVYDLRQCVLDLFFCLYCHDRRVKQSSDLRNAAQLVGVYSSFVRPLWT